MVTNLPQFKAYSNKLKKEVEQIAWKRSEEAGGMAEQLAKKNAPHDLGFHAQNIGHRPSTENIGTVLYANAKYAPYLEFGTGGTVDVPSGFEDLAKQFIGKGIKQINLPARPHIIPAAYKAKAFMEKQILKDIEKL